MSREKHKKFICLDFDWFPLFQKFQEKNMYNLVGNYVSFFLQLDCVQ